MKTIFPSCNRRLLPSTFIISKPFSFFLQTQNLNHQTSHTHYFSTPNPNPNNNDFTTISHLLINSNPLTPSFIHSLSLTGICPTPSLVQQLFDQFRDFPRFVYYLFLWAEKHDDGFSPSSLGMLFNGMIKVFARAKEFERALCLILDRLKRGVEEVPDLDTFAILIRRYARAGMSSPAIKSLQFASSLNLKNSSNLELKLLEILVDSFCKEGLVLEASKFINEESERDPDWVPSVHVYNALLSGWFRSRQHQRINELLDEMRKYEVKSNVVTYGTLVEGFCSMSRVEEAILLVRQMKNEGIEPNAFIYNPIIDALGKVGRFKEALAMLERFLVLEMGPSFSTYDSLVKSFCKAGDINGTNKILKMMIGRGFIPTATTYNHLLRYYSNADKTDEGLNLYIKMSESGYTPNRISCLILMKMLCKEERLDLAMQVRKEMKGRGYDLDFTAYTLLIHLLCDMYRLEEAFGELKEMIHVGIVPPYTTCLKMFDGFKKQRNMQMSRELSDMVASVPQLTKLHDTYGRDDDASCARRRSIISKAKEISDTLKICRNPRKLAKKRSNWKSVRG